MPRYRLPDYGRLVNAPAEDGYTVNWLATYSLLTLLVMTSITMAFFVLARHEKNLISARCWFLSFTFLSLSLAALLLLALPLPTDAELLTGVLCATSTSGFMLQYMGVRSWLGRGRRQPALWWAAALSPLGYGALYFLDTPAAPLSTTLAQIVAFVFPVLGAYRLLRATAPRQAAHSPAAMFLLLHPAALAVAIGAHVFTGQTGALPYFAIHSLEQPITALFLLFSFPASLVGAAIFFLLGIAIDLTRSLAGEAIRDPLAAVLNRKGVLELGRPLLEKARSESRPLSVVVADLDDFKRINDRLGHAGGDAVLREFARMLKSGIRRSDLCCRWCGEQFLLVLPKCNESQACAVAEKLRRQLEHAGLEASECHLPLSASFSAAEFEPQDTDLEQLIVRADKALHYAKSHGKNRVARASGIYPEEMAAAPVRGLAAS